MHAQGHCVLTQELYTQALHEDARFADGNENDNDNEDEVKMK